jgi:acyl carrier protein
MSLDFFGVVVSTEKEFGVRVTQEDLEGVVTVGDYARLVVSLMLDQGRDPGDPGEFMGRLIARISEESGVDARKITEHTRLVDDLCF